MSEAGVVSESVLTPMRESPGKCTTPIELRFRISGAGVMSVKLWSLIIALMDCRPT